MAEEQVINCGYWMYLGNSDAPENPRILTRAEKGQALTHLEMDVNLASLLHTAKTSSEGSSFTPEEYSEGTDVYFEGHKPTRKEEMEGLFATFSYAPIKQGEGESEEVLVQYEPIKVKVQHTTDEIRYKLSNELIPGTLDIAEDFRVTGSAFVKENVSVSGNLNVAHDSNTNTLNVNSSSVFRGDVRALGTASFDGDVYVKGKLYVNGVLYGNLAQPGYNSLTNPGYAQAYQRFGVQDTGSQSDAALKENLEPLKTLDVFGIVDSITPYRFDWKPEAEKSGSDVGVIAQEVQEVFPEAVSKGQDGYLRVDYVKLIPILLGAIRGLRSEVAWLKARI